MISSSASSAVVLSLDVKIATLTWVCALLGFMDVQLGLVMEVIMAVNVDLNVLFVVKLAVAWSLVGQADLRRVSETFLKVAVRPL